MGITPAVGVGVPVVHPASVNPVGPVNRVGYVDKQLGKYRQAKGQSEYFSKECFLWPLCFCERKKAAKGKPNMIDLIPDSKELSEIFAQAIAPTFFLGAIAAFISLMNLRLSAVMQRVQHLNGIAEDDLARAHLKSDIERLRSRVHFLKSGILAALYSGLCATVLLGVLFVAALFKFNHAYGAPLLFLGATLLLGFALLRFAQEARISLADADEHH